MNRPKALLTLWGANRPPPPPPSYTIINTTTLSLPLPLPTLILAALLPPLSLLNSVLAPVLGRRLPHPPHLTPRALQLLQLLLTTLLATLLAHTTLLPSPGLPL